MHTIAQWWASIGTIRPTVVAEGENVGGAEKTGVMENDLTMLQINSETMQAWNNGLDKTLAISVRLRLVQAEVDAAGQTQQQLAAHEASQDTEIHA